MYRAWHLSSRRRWPLGFAPGSERRSIDWSAAHRRKRTGRKYQFQAGLNQQALGVQIKAKRRRVVVARRAVCSGVYCRHTRGKRYRYRDPFQVDAICRQTCVVAVYRCTCIKGVGAGRVRAMVLAVARRWASVVRRPRGRDRVGDAIGVVVKGSRKRFATREKCSGKPESHPTQHQGHARRPVPTRWPPDLRHPRDTSHR